MTPTPDDHGVLVKACAFQLASLGHVRYSGLNPSSEWPAHVVDMPPTPDQQVGILPRAGFPDNDLSGYAYPELQIVVRTPSGTGWDLGYNKAKAIQSVLNNTGNLVWAADTQYAQHILTCDANEPEPFWLGPDTNDRPRWSVSFQIHAPTLEVTP